MNFLLFDIGNTHTHLGLANEHRVFRQINIRTAAWFDGTAPMLVTKFVGKTKLTGAALCSVVPKATPEVAQATKRLWKFTPLALTPDTNRGVGINYPKPHTIGPDRLANAIAVRHHYGAPAVVVDFGTAVTFDVVDKRGDYVGGIIAPGLAAMTDYLHEKTALLPKIKIREVRAVIGTNTEQAMPSSWPRRSSRGIRPPRARLRSLVGVGLLTEATLLLFVGAPRGPSRAPRGICVLCYAILVR